MNRHGLEVIELGNADVFGEGQYVGTPDTADGHAAPLPIYPLPTDLPPSPIARIRDEFGDALIGFVCGVAVASYGAFVFLQHVVLS